MSSKNDTTTSGNASPSGPPRDALDSDSNAVRAHSRVDRRTFVKGLGASAAGAFALGSNRGFTTMASANGTLEMGLVSTVVGGPAMLAGWALREYEIIGSDAPAEGLTAEVLKQTAYETARARKSTNASTVVDNQNILDGVEHTAYTNAKIAAIEELNAGSAEADVLDAATTTAETYFTTIQKNLIESWNESIRELEKLRASEADHPDLSTYDLVNPDGGTQDYNLTIGSSTHTLPDGTDISVKNIDVEDTARADSDTYRFNETWDLTGSINSNTGSNAGKERVIRVVGPDDYVEYLRFDDWTPIWSPLETTIQNVLDGLSTWVASVYGDVQSGSIEVSELVTPRERASMMAEEEGMSQAIADLIALNMPVDPEREATITISSTDATLTGTFGLSDSSDGPIETGVTYDPSTFSGDVYFTADMSLVEGNWSAIETSVDGGTITITSEPYEGTAVEVTTTAGETVTVPAADWTDNGDGTWSYDASGDLETPITEVGSARFHATATDTSYETIKLEDSFTVDEMVNTQTGEPATSTTFTSSEPQTDSNYITQEEWDELEQQNQELIEQYENTQGGGSFSLDGLDLFGLPGEAVALIAAAVVAVFATSN